MNPALTITAADPATEECQACIGAYLRELQERFDHGFDPALSVSAHPDELVPPHGHFLLARLDGDAVGCGALKLQADGDGELKRMWVARSARGLGIGQRLLASLEALAKASGVRVLRLDTNRHLAEARQLYLRNGYVEIAPYNDNPYAHYWFEKRLD
jgi:GNAT superfamily N-acetyltransferase